MKRLILSTIFAVVAFTINAQQIDNIKLQNDFLRDINNYRKTKGLSAVKLDTICIQLAKDQAEYCAKNDILTHDRIGGRDFPFSSVGENGTSSSVLVNSQTCLTGWISSHHHNLTLVWPSAARIGIYSAKSKNGIIYTFLIVTTNP